MYLYIFASISFILSFIYYSTNVYPTISVGNPGEYITASCTFGNTYPPGYPTFIMLAQIFLLNPYGNPAWKLNIMSAFLSSLVSVFVYLILELIYDKPSLHMYNINILLIIIYRSICNFTLSMWYTMSHTAKYYASVADIFSLNAFLYTLLLYTYLYSSKHQSIYSNNWFYLICGLSCTCHHTLVFMVIPLFIFHIIIKLMDLKDNFQYKSIIKHIFNMFLFIFIGLSPYFFLFELDENRPIGSWGDLSTWSGFFKHIFRYEINNEYYLPPKINITSQIYNTNFWKSVNEKQYKFYLIPITFVIFILFIIVPYLYKMINISNYLSHWNENRKSFKYHLLFIVFNSFLYYYLVFRNYKSLEGHLFPINTHQYWMLLFINLSIILSLMFNTILSCFHKFRWFICIFI